jgi:hypothetical protein
MKKRIGSLIMIFGMNIFPVQAQDLGMSRTADQNALRLRRFCHGPSRRVLQGCALPPAPLYGL